MWSENHSTDNDVLTIQYSSWPTTSPTSREERLKENKKIRKETGKSQAKKSEEETGEEELLTRDNNLKIGTLWRYWRNV